MIQANPKRYVLKSWNGGMTNDEYVGQPGSFQNGEGVDIRKNSKAFFLSQNSKFEQNITTAGSGGFTTAFLGTQTSDMMVMLSNGLILNFLTLAVLYTPTITFQSIRNYALGFNLLGNTVGILVGQAQNQVSSFTYTNTPTITVTEGVITSGALQSNTIYRPLLINENKLLIGDGNYVSSIDQFGVVVNDLALQRDDEVRGITRIGDQIVVFAVNGTLGKLYYWDGVATAPNRVIIWYDNPAYNIANLGNTTYCWNKNGIFISDGYTRQFLYKAYQGQEGVNQFIAPEGQFTNAIETLDRVVYFPGKTIGDGVSSGTGAVLSYGEYQPGFPKSLVKEFTFGTTTGAECTALNWATPAFSGFPTPRLFLGYSQSTSRYAVQLGGYGASGFIETNPIIGDNESSIKQAKRIRFGYKLPTTDTSIKIYVKVNDSATWTLIHTTTDITKRRDTFNYDSTFNKIQFKLELISTNNVYTPYFFDFNLIYNDIQDDI